MAPHETVALLRGKVDELVCLEMPEPFYAIGLHYRDFHQIADEEVVKLMRAAAITSESAATPDMPAR